MMSKYELIKDIKTAKWSALGALYIGIGLLWWGANWQLGVGAFFVIGSVHFRIDALQATLNYRVVG